MTENKQLTQKDTSTGDAAVDGLFSGAIAGVLMAAYLVGAGLLMGEGAGTVLGRLAPSEGASPLVGALVHLAVSAVYGALFGAVWRLAPPRWRNRLLTGLAGLTYGVALLLLAEFVILPRTDSPLLEVQFVHFAVAQITYGLALGFLIHRGGRT